MMTKSGRTKCPDDDLALKIRALCSAYLECDDWGQEAVLNFALAQASRRRIARSSRPLRVVDSTSSLDEDSHVFDDVVDGLALPLVCKPIDTQ